MKVRTNAPGVDPNSLEWGAQSTIRPGKQLLRSCRKRAFNWSTPRFSIGAELSAIPYP